jgi:predicted transcriptional regulator
MSKQAVVSAIKIKIGIELTPEVVDSLLDNLWFEELIYTEGTNEKRYGLTKKGTKKKYGNIKTGYF